ncbi:unnamed protein product [Ilex paraguariensis]|uniref:S1 motif domain-containing protein n=1 Tax=Ilex paraguariensis TaxID=185542 RepID=A0ABC8RDJ4_9AQUA
MGGGGKRSVVSDEEEEEVEEVYGKTVDDESDNEEEDEEGQDEYQKDGFIVDDEEEEVGEEEQDEGKSQKKRKKKKRDSQKNFELDEDDYELLEDNISGFHRPKMANPKFKRLKRVGKDTEKGVYKSLFDDDDDDMIDIAEEEERPNEEQMVVDEEDDMADFIVDEEEEMQVGGASMRQRKQPKLRQLSGVSTAALAEAQDIFGDVDEFLDLRKKGLARSDIHSDSGRGRRNLEDEYEPSILVEKYMTERDDRIRQIDLPERIQISEERTGSPPVDERSIREESSWIHNQLPTISWIFKKIDTDGNVEEPDLLSKIDKEDIMRFLKLHHVDKHDIPFIALYRKELCLSLLKDPGEEEAENGDRDRPEKKPRLKWHKLLWAVKNLDRKWLLLHKRKSILQSCYKKRYEEESRLIYDEERLNLNRQLLESIIRSLDHADSEREIDDVDLKFNLHFPPGEVGVDEGQFKRPKRKSLYSICNKAGLWEVAGKFGPNAEQFGLQVTLEKVNMELSEDPKETPEEFATNFTCSLFETPEAVLKGARHVAATEISCEPSFRKHVRSIFMEKAEVTTRPTPEGNMAIDSFHQFAGVKWLRGKPLFKFEDAQWLLIQKAEEQKLLQVAIKLPENELNKLIEESNVCYLSDGVSISARLWNEQRKLVLQDAFFKFLFPSMEKEICAMLTTRAKDWLVIEYGHQLWNKVSVAPFCRDGDKDEAAPRVMACCWGPGKPATTFVMLDSSGEVLDVLLAGSLHLRSQNVIDQQRKKNDQERLLKFMNAHQPHIMVLGAVNLSCTRLKAEIFEIVFNIVEENPRNVGQEMDQINIVYGDESLPHLYEYSQISSDQLPGQSGIFKRAVALGRFHQNPVAMVASLCGAGREIVSWKVSSLEHFLTSDEKYEMIEQIMVDVTNQVGIDINLAACHDWLFSPLQFVSGLGPRKAASLQRALIKAGAVRNRKELTGHRLSTKKVFINAVGFLRVRPSGLMAFSDDIDLLDDSRIHPESYALAELLAKTVHEHYAPGYEDDAEQELAIEYVRSNPGQLKSFDIDQYADDNGMTNKKETLRGIKLELLHGFQDWRKPFAEPTADEVFYMISGENEDSLAEGKIVHVTVRRVQPQRAICVLESGLTGMLSKEDISDEGDEFDLAERLHEGDTLSCKIKNVQMNRYHVFLTCRGIEFKGRQLQDMHHADPYYHEDNGALPCQQDKNHKDKDLVNKQFKPRIIVHPRFQNMTSDEAINFLSDKDAGASFFHPSSRGPCYLTLTMRIYDGVYAHKDITECGKDHTDVTSLLRIGKILKIGDETFEDLDEVMDRYVDPLVSNLKAMLNYRKFKRGSKAEVDDLLRAEKSDYPMRIVYGFGVSYEHPGTFILSYIRSTNPHHEYVGLYPKGFKFRKRAFDNIDQLVAYFQKHIDDLQHVSTPSFQSVAAMVPVRSPAFKGSPGGAPMRNDWGGQSNLDKNKSATDSRGRNDYKADGDHGHPSGLPKPYGGHGHGRGSNHGSNWDNKGSSERKDCGYGITSTWGSDSREKGGSDTGWGNFPGAMVENSPTKEAFQGGWGRGGSGGNWGSVGGSNGGWGGNHADGRSSGGNWGGGGGNTCGTASSGNWGSGGSASGWGGSSADGGGTSDDKCGVSGGGWRASGGPQGSNGGCGRGRGSHYGQDNNNSNEIKDSSFHTSSAWGTDSKGRAGSDGGWSNFSGAKVLSSANNNWNGGGGGGTGGNAGGWGSRIGNGSTGGGKSQGAWSASLSDQGGDGGQGRGCGRGRGRGRGRNSCGDCSTNERKDFSYATSSKWGSNSNEGIRIGRNNFPGARVQNSPSKEAFPGDWGSRNGIADGGNGGWGGSTGGGGWGGDGKGTGDNWGDIKSADAQRASGWGAGGGYVKEGSGGWGDKNNNGGWGGKSVGCGSNWGDGRSVDGKSQSSWAAGNANNSKGIGSSGGWGDKSNGGWGGNAGTEDAVSRGGDSDGWGVKSGTADGKGEWDFAISKNNANSVGETRNSGWGAGSGKSSSIVPGGGRRGPSASGGSGW